MPLQIKITTTPVERGDKKVLRDSLREGLRVIAGSWHLLYKKLKFSNAAETRYNLAPRQGDGGSGRQFKGSYQQQKLRKFGHSRPFEWSGQSRQLAMGGNNVEVTAQNYQVGSSAAIVYAPTFNLAKVKSDNVPLRQEFEKVIPEEVRHLNKLGVKKYDLTLARARGRRTKTVK